MRIFILILIFLHGFIHILGFLKGFGLKEVKELKLPISRTMGLFWLTATVLFLIFGFFKLANFKYTWITGFIAVLVSQLLIILFWKDAKYGTLPNIVILIVLFISYGNYSFNRLVQRETTNLIKLSESSSEKMISENDLKELPQSVKKWLHRSGAIGKPQIRIGKVNQHAKMKLKPGQDKWLNAEATQYSIINTPSFIWTVDVEMNNLIYFRGRDKFVEGKGEMLIKLNSVINIVDEKGHKLNESTLQRYLGEMVWFPSLAFSPYITWQEIDDTTAIATMNYNGTKGSGTFYFNSKGDFIKFSALRYKENIPGAKRYEWVVLVEDYKTFEGIKVPSKMSATWHLEDSNWTWLRLEVTDIKYNENATSADRYKKQN